MLQHIMKAEQRQQLDIAIAKVAGHLEDAIDKALEVSDAVSRKYWEIHHKIEQHNPHAILGILYGFMLLFFGRNFAITFTVLEAFRHGGSAAFFAHVEKMQKRLHNARHRTEMETSPEQERESLTRAQLASKLTKPLLSIVAVMKVKFAKYAALGISVGEDLNRAVQRFVLPLLLSKVDPKYHSQLPGWIGQACHYFGIAFALVMYRYINIVATSVRGAFTIARNIQDYCQSHDIKAFEVESHADFYLVCFLIPIGITFQTFGYSNLPIAIRLLFFPTFILEYVYDSVMALLPAIGTKR